MLARKETIFSPQRHKEHKDFSALCVFVVLNPHGIEIDGNVCMVAFSPGALIKNHKDRKDTKRN